MHLHCRWSLHSATRNFLSNASSLDNKIEELLLLLMAKNKNFSSAALCFTETWLCGSAPDSVLPLDRFQLFRADRHTELSGKRKVEESAFILTVAGVKKLLLSNNTVFLVWHFCSSTMNPFTPTWVRFIHFDRCVHSTASQCTGGTAHIHQSNTLCWADKLRLLNYSSWWL